MEIAGIQFDTLTVLQVMVTAVIVGAYSLHTALQLPDSDHLSEAQTILLASFVLDHDPHTETLGMLVEANDEVLANEDNEVYFTQKRLDSFKKDGGLPTKSMAPSDTIWSHFGSLSIGPIMALGLLAVVASERRRYRAYRVLHTEMRKNGVAHAALYAVASAAYGLAGIYLVTSVKWLGLVLIAVSSIGVLSSVVATFLFARWQQAWKSFWQDKLLDVLATADHAGDNALFNRAFSLKCEVDRQPDLPIPGGIAMYTLVFSAVQAALLWASTLLS